MFRGQNAGRTDAGPCKQRFTDHCTYITTRLWSSHGEEWKTKGDQKGFLGDVTLMLLAYLGGSSSSFVMAIRTSGGED